MDTKDKIIAKQDEFITYLLKYLIGTSKRIKLFQESIVDLKAQLKEQEEKQIEKEVYYRETWMCPRCGLINSYLKLTCDCKPLPFDGGTTYIHQP